MLNWRQEKRQTHRNWFSSTSLKQECHSLVVPRISQDRLPCGITRLPDSQHCCHCEALSFQDTNFLGYMWICVYIWMSWYPDLSSKIRTESPATGAAIPWSRRLGPGLTCETRVSQGEITLMLPECTWTFYPASFPYWNTIQSHTSTTGEKSPQLFCPMYLRMIPVVSLQKGC